MAERKYFKFDEINQFLDNDEDINYFSTNQARRVAVGNMLGDFDENGFYVVDKKIVSELVDMPKIVADSVDDADLVRSAIKFDNFLHFMVTFDDDCAKLILLEKINFESNIGYNAGSYSNMNEYVLKEIKIPDRDVDRNVVYTKFNIQRMDEGKVYDINSLTFDEQSNFSAIIDKIKYNYLAQNELLKNEKAIEKIEAEYFDNILSSFEKFPQEKESFKLLIKKTILDKINFVKINKPFFQKTINEMLDNCLRVMLAKLTPAQRDEIETKIRDVKNKYYQEYNKIIHIQFVNSVNAQKEVVQDNIISEVINSKQTNIKVMKMQVDEPKLENSLDSILEENNLLKKQVELDNSNEKTITAHNPELKQFFNEFKQEMGVDVLNSEPTKFEVKDKAEVKKPETEQAKSEIKKPEAEQVKAETKTNEDLEAKVEEEQVTKKTSQDEKSDSEELKTSQEHKETTTRRELTSDTDYSDYSTSTNSDSLVTKVSESNASRKRKTVAKTSAQTASAQTGNKDHNFDMLSK